MKAIDLHGIKHENVEDTIINACVSLDVPFLVITGKSGSMKSLVASAAKLMGLNVRDTIDNPGRVIVYEGR